MQVNPINFDYSQSALIKSPFEDLKNREVQLKQTRVVIDSRDRDVRLFPTPASYEVQLESDIEEVTSVQLLLADVPLVAYNISNNNNQLLVQVDTNNYNVTVPIGNYDAPTLAANLQTALNAQANAGGTVMFAVTYDALTDRVTVSCDHPFAMVADGSTLLKALGIPVPPPTAANTPATVVSTPDGAAPNLQHVITPPFRCNLDDNRYVVMNIQQVSLNTSANSVLHKSFAVLGRNGLTNTNYLSLTSKVAKTLNPPVARLTKLRITFTDYYGNTYDFQNHDHRIELLFESRKHLLRFT